MDSLRVNAWILAKMTKSSSALDSSRQLFKLNIAVSSENCWEHEPSFGPRVHPQPSWRNFLSLLTNSSPFSLSPCCSAIVFRKTVFFFVCGSIPMLLLSWKCAWLNKWTGTWGFCLHNWSTWLFLLGDRKLAQRSIPTLSFQWALCSMSILIQHISFGE